MRGRVNEEGEREKGGSTFYKITQAGNKNGEWEESDGGECPN